MNLGSEAAELNVFQPSHSLSQEVGGEGGGGDHNLSYLDSYDIF